MLRKGDPYYHGEQVRTPSFAEAWDRTVSRMPEGDRSEASFDAVLAETATVAKLDFAVLSREAEAQRRHDPRGFLLDLLSVTPIESDMDLVPNT